MPQESQLYFGQPPREIHQDMGALHRYAPRSFKITPYSHDPIQLPYSLRRPRFLCWGMKAKMKRPRASRCGSYRLALGEVGKVSLKILIPPQLTQ